jgi:hypothetical protein
MASNMVLTTTLLLIFVALTSIPVNGDVEDEVKTLRDVEAKVVVQSLRWRFSNVGWSRRRC